MQIEQYSDSRGNRIEWSGEPIANTEVTFRGSGNRLVVHSPVKFGRVAIQFDCDNGVVEISSSVGVPAFIATIRVGQDSTVVIGPNVSTTGSLGISATEGTTVSIGEDCMFAIGVQLRADDGHPIFDVATGHRVNVSRDIVVGDHVWLGYNSTVLGGVSIGSGAVIGFGSIVTKAVPNNSVAAGNPARIVRRDIAWERPHLSLVEPYYKPDASTVEKTRWWAMSDDEAVPVARGVSSRTVESDSPRLEEERAKSKSTSARTWWRR
ncbi:acyltransferase [Microbacterium sp. C7(2022)]|uniref:acyltransferase n=1 Tax=Microbacterium sp. C7(2022) TaxID=2992759 RepID=UPI00237A7733|nr:acyltransferase [Microbacterium sp. C7(2022)]MDE0547320.1 acyltransferase [Microbacterium sp. C7(2022)]